jgi:transcriptional regulator with XRE-family HTH domain
MQTSCRSRRSSREIEIDRLTDETVKQLGQRVRDARRRRRLTQGQLGEVVGLSQSEISRLEVGRGHGTPIGTWLALATAINLMPRFDLARDPRAEPVDAGHLQVQELLLRLATTTGRRGRFELPISRGDPSLSVDVFVRDDPNRLLIVEEAWNSIRDIGAGARSFQSKVALAEDLGVAIGGESPFRARGVWVVRATHANRELLARYPEVFGRLFPGSSGRWAEALETGSPPPDEPGLVWCDVNATRVCPWRRRYSTVTPARSSSGSG